jgi:acyl-coenzyme A synthetase/AMP-(fatty) acid ligase
VEVGSLTRSAELHLINLLHRGECSACVTEGQLGVARLINTYGTTEVAWIAVTTSGSRSQDGPKARHTVGTYILDRRLKAVPIGVTGELYVGGTALARGYLNRQDLTAERFVADPHGVGKRMFRTGQLARWLVDGTLQFTRRCRRIKMRGSWVNVEEVEAALQAQDGIAQAVIAIQKDTDGRTWLVGYVVPCMGCAPDPALLECRLREVLPGFMLPRTIVWLQRLPQTALGHLDPRHLPVPQLREQGLRQPRIRRNWNAL